MELLGLLLAGLVEGLVVLVTGMISAMAGLFSALADFLGSASSAAASAASGKREEKDHPIPRTCRRISAFLRRLMQRRWLRYSLRAVAVIGLLFTGAAIWLSTAGFPIVARWSLGVLEERAHLKVEFEKVAGNLFTGRFRFEELTMTSTPENPREISGHCDLMEAQLRVTSLFRRAPVIDQFVLRRGRLDIHDPRPPEETTRHPAERKPLPNFIAHNLEIENFSLRHQGSGVDPITATIHQWRADRVRSRWFAFDLLMRSHLEAAIDEATVLVTSEATTSGRNTRWEVEDLPVTVAARVVPSLRLMREGTVDAKVKDRWSRSPLGDQIVFDWELTFRGIRAEPPADAQRFTVPLYSAASAYFNAEAQRQIRVSMTMTPDQFDGAVSLDATELWGTFSQVLMDSIAERTGISREDQTTILDAAGDAAIRFLDRRRKPSED